MNEQTGLVAVFVLLLWCPGVVGQDSKHSGLSMADTATLESLDGQWSLDEYNEDGVAREWKRKLFQDAHMVNGSMTHQMNIGGGNPALDVIRRVERIDPDKGHIRFAVSTAGQPAVTQWAKIYKDQMVFCCNSDRAENQSAIPREFEAREGLTLMTWSRVPSRQDDQESEIDLAEIRNHSAESLVEPEYQGEPTYCLLVLGKNVE